MEDSSRRKKIVKHPEDEDKAKPVKPTTIRKGKFPRTARITGQSSITSFLAPMTEGAVFKSQSEENCSTPAVNLSTISVGTKTTEAKKMKGDTSNTLRDMGNNN